MEHDYCVHELPDVNGKRKSCKHGEGMECEFCHVAHPEASADIAFKGDDDNLKDGYPPLLRDATE